MMSNMLSVFNKYFNWWITTLLSCLPEKLLAYFKKYNRQVDLVIAHKGESIFIQDGNSQIIDSISVKTTASSDEILDAELDFSIRADSGDAPDHIIGDINIDQVDQTEVVRHLFKNRSTSDNSFQSESIEVRDNEDTTILFNREDCTTRLLDIVKEEDTVIIKDDQGTLLTFNPQASTAQEDTVIYFNDRGTMRPVERETKPEITTDIDFVLNEPDIQQSDDSADIFYLAAGLARKYKRRKKCLYLLPDERVFSLTLSYPIEVLENIETVLRFDLEKHIPLSFHEIRYFYALNINKPQDKVDVDIVVIKTTDYNVLQNAFDFNQNDPVICTTQYFYKNYGTKVNFLEQNSKTNRKSLINGGRFHIALNLFLLSTLLILPYYLYYQELLTTEVKSDQEIQKVSSIVSTINELNSEISLGSKLSLNIKNDLRMVYLLAQLSENIDTNAWITRFTYKNGEVKIKGEARSATSVSDSLNDTGLFESIKFISSIVKNPITQKESFELSLRIKSDA